MSDPYDPFTDVVVLVLIAIVFVLISVADEKTAAKDEGEYCKMVALHKKDPTKGWAPYKGEQFCPR